MRASAFRAKRMTAPLLEKHFRASHSSPVLHECSGLRYNDQDREQVRMALNEEEEVERMSNVKTTIIFVRHAQSVHPFSDDRSRPLTEAGLKDREVVVETLKDRHIDAFISSPYKRSFDTIATAAELRGMEIQTDERFRERKSGINPRSFLDRRWADFSFSEEGGECYQSVQDRNMEALKEVLKKYEGKTVVIGTHGTALSTILNYYNPAFGAEDFLRIVAWMPYIVELEFENGEYLGMRELAHVQKPYLEIDFSTITACGESCTKCEKKLDGRCPGCIEADGYVPGWKESGRCKIHACTREHGVQFCGLCEKFPCENTTKLIHWNKDIIARLTYLRNEYNRKQR